MNALVIPVKGFRNAKKRLGRQFTAAAREELAAALCEDFFGVVGRARGLERIMVVSSEPEVLKRAEEMGFERLTESAQESESASVDAACRLCAEQGVESVLRLPVDLPLLEPEDITSLFAEKPEGPGMLIVPSRDGSGTNALLRTPPDLFPSRFGGGSFARHVAEGEAAGGRVCVVRNFRVELDLDELEDLQAFAALGARGTKAWGWLERQLPLAGIEEQAGLRAAAEGPAGP